MAKKIRAYRDHYIITYADELFLKKYISGNFSKSMRNLWNLNEVLQKAWPKLSARSFANKMTHRLADALYSSKKKTGTSEARVYLVPRNHVNAKDLNILVLRVPSSKPKVLQD